MYKPAIIKSQSFTRNAAKCNWSQKVHLLIMIENEAKNTIQQCENEEHEINITLACYSNIT
jgi:hypothetical protein